MSSESDQEFEDLYNATIQENQNAWNSRKNITKLMNQTFKEMALQYRLQFFIHKDNFRNLQRPLRNQELQPRQGEGSSAARCAAVRSAAASSNAARQHCNQVLCNQGLQNLTLMDND